jgi:anti-sigma B factor antagonist
VQAKLEVLNEVLDGQVQVIGLRGELDVATASQLAQPLSDAVESGRTEVVVDLSELTFMDSTGLLVLLNGLRRLFRKGGRLAVTCTNPTVLRLFEITGTDATFTITATREAARAAVAAGAAPANQS